MEERLKYSDKAKEDLQYWKKTNNVARAMPSTDVLTKLANALNVSTEYLLNGTNEDFANEILIDKELLNQFKSIEKFSEEKKHIVKELIDAFILKSNLQQQLSI